MLTILRCDPVENITKLGRACRLKDNVGPPDRYLGGNVENIQTNDGYVAWSLSCYDYLTNAVQQVKEELDRVNLSLK